MINIEPVDHSQPEELTKEKIKELYIKQSLDQKKHQEELKNLNDITRQIILSQRKLRRKESVLDVEALYNIDDELKKL